MPPIDFTSDVLERSHDVPVVVDFWAAWCAPCRTLGPVLDELAGGAGGRWELVKLDTEAQPDVATSYGVMGIPAVKMFPRGEIIAEFTGALPRDTVQCWLDEHLPDPSQEQLDSLMDGWERRVEELVPALEEFVREHPDHPAGRLRLAQAVVARDPSRARALIREANPGVDLADPVADIRSLADLMEIDGDIPPRLAPHLQGAQEALRSGDPDGALEHLVEAVMRDKEYGDQVARRAAVALFRLLGHQHELTEKHRRLLSMALHS